MALWYSDQNYSFDHYVSAALEAQLGARVLQLAFLPANITAKRIALGDLDGTVVNYFTAMKAKTLGGRKIILRPMNEMNTDWTAPGSSHPQKYGGDPVAFKAAWRRLYNIAERLGALNANTAFMWSPDVNGFQTDPNCQSTPLSHCHVAWMDYYPGHNYTDWVGVSAYSESCSESVESLLSQLDSDFGSLNTTA